MELCFIQAAVQRGRYDGHENGCNPIVCKTERRSVWSRAFAVSVNWDQGFKSINRHFDRLSEGLRTGSHEEKLAFLKIIEDEYRKRDSELESVEIDKYWQSPSTRGKNFCDQMLLNGSRSFLGGELILRKDLEREWKLQQKIDEQKREYEFIR